jgi:hypothetical protein
MRYNYPLLIVPIGVGIMLGVVLGLVIWLLRGTPFTLSNLVLSAIVGGLLCGFGGWIALSPNTNKGESPMKVVHLYGDVYVDGMPINEYILKSYEQKVKLVVLNK